MIPNEGSMEIRDEQAPSVQEDELERQVALCAVCHARERDFSESSQSVLCSQCRQDYIALRIPVKIRLFLVAVCAVFLFSLYFLPSVLSTYQTYIKADKQMKAREYVFAYNSYASVLAQYSGSVTVALKTAEAALSAQYIAELAQTLDAHLVGRSLNDADYEKAMKYISILDAYFLTMDEVQRIIEATTKDFPDPLSAEYGDAVAEQCKALLSKEGIDKTQVYFAMGSLTSNAEDQAEYFRLATEQDPRFTYPYAYYGTALRRLGKVDEAEQVYQKALALHVCDAFSMRGLGVLQLLKGDKQGALETIRRAYAIDSADSYIADALIIALCENNQREEATALRDELTKQGMEFEDDLAQYLDGKLNLQQYYMS